MNKEAFEAALKDAPVSDIKNIITIVCDRDGRRRSLYSNLLDKKFLDNARFALSIEEIPDWIEPRTLFPALAKERRGDVFQRRLGELLDKSQAAALVEELSDEALTQIEENCALDPEELLHHLGSYAKIRTEGVINVLIDHDREWLVDFLVTQLGFTDQTDVLYNRAAKLSCIRFADYEKEEAILLVDVIL